MLDVSRGAGFLSAPMRGDCPDTVYFSFASHELCAESRAVLDWQASWLKRSQEARLEIEGHADDHGTDAYDRSLGWRRAETIKVYLVALGVDATRIDTVSIGRDRPAVMGRSEAAWAKNRRAVLVHGSSIEKARA